MPATSTYRLILLFTTLLLASSVSAQWQQLVPPDTLRFYRCVHVINDSTAVVGGTDLYGANPRGVLLTTFDQGQTWDTTYTLQSIWAIHFPTADTGYTAGSGGTIHTSTNGGLDWTELDTDTLNGLGLRTVFFTSGSTGFIGHADSGNLLRKTTDRGNTWQEVQNLDRARQIFFPTTTTGYAVTPYGLEVSTNGGNDWSLISLPDTGSCSYDGLVFASETTGWVTGNGFLGPLQPAACIAKTSDGGQHWDVQLIADYGLEPSVFFQPNNRVTLVGGGASLDSPTLVRSPDGGINWYQQTVTPPQFNFRAAHAHDQFGLAVGAGGYIYRTLNDGGPLGDLVLSTTADLPKAAPIRSKLYPNPASNYLNIECPWVGMDERVVVRFTNLMGHLVWSLNRQPGTRMSIDLNHLQKGAYIIEIQQGKQVTRNQLMVVNS